MPISGQIAALGINRCEGGREAASKGAPGPICLGGAMKLKKPAYREGIDFDAAYLTPTEADELLQLMKSQPFADNRVSYGPQVPRPPGRAMLGRTATLGQRTSSPSAHSSGPAAALVRKIRLAVQLRAVQQARRYLRGQAALRPLPGGCDGSGRC